MQVLFSSCLWRFVLFKNDSSEKLKLFCYPDEGLIQKHDTGIHLMKLTYLFPVFAHHRDADAR